MGLHFLCRAPQQAPLHLIAHSLRPGTDGQTDAGDAPFCDAPSGLVALASAEAGRGDREGASIPPCRGLKFHDVPGATAWWSCSEPAGPGVPATTGECIRCVCDVLVEDRLANESGDFLSSP